MIEPEVEQTEEAPKKKGNFYNNTGKKRKIGFKLKMALLEIIERKRLSDRVDYKAVAHRHGLTAENMRQVYYQWKGGRVDLGDPETAQEKQIDARVQHEKALLLIRRYKALVMNGFEAAILNAEDDTTNGKKDSWKQVSPILRELKSLSEIQSIHEKGYASILEDFLAMRDRAEKQIGPMPASVATETQIIHANDEERALAALTGNHG